MIIQLYIRAELSDPSKHLVEIGTGYFVELDREKAKAIFDRKKEHITKQVRTSKVSYLSI